VNATENIRLRLSLCDRCKSVKMAQRSGRNLENRLKERDNIRHSDFSGSGREFRTSGNRHDRITIALVSLRSSDAKFVGLLSRGYRVAPQMEPIHHATPEDSVMSHKSIRRHFLWKLSAVWKSFTVYKLCKSDIIAEI